MRAAKRGDSRRRASVAVATEQSAAGEYPYVYRWNRCGRKGERCKVTARGTLNSCRVEFADGGVIITSRNALMRYRPETA
jgi:hypothetical protein